MAKQNKPQKKKPLVAILMGSKNDLEKMKKTAEVLASFGIPYEMKVLSAHRTPEETAAYVKNAEKNGVCVFVAGAGMAAHLAGAVAAHTTLPVIGVPLGASLSGLDSLLATVQMPPGIPVATVAVDGAKNAGYLAAQILSLKFKNIQEKLKANRSKIRNEILKTSVS